MTSLAEFDLQGILDTLVAYKVWILYITGALVGIWIVQRVMQSILRAIRLRQPPVIHPRLQKYSVDQGELDRQRQEQAKSIVATSSNDRLAGFRIVRQVEAVFVEGYRTPEDAVIALKAAAADRGANALLNVKTERTAAGRCTASGDAIVAAALQIRPRSMPVSPSPPPPADKNDGGAPPA